MRRKWVADTGASSHMSNDLRHFKTIRMFTTPSKATVGDGESADELGIGHAAYLNNRLPTKRSNITLYERFSKR